MASGDIQIKAMARKPGKSISRQMRSNKLIPSVVYGPKTENTYFAITELDATRYSTRAFENSIFTLKSDDKKLNGMRVLKKDVTIHPVHRRPIHLDFYAPDMTQTVRVSVEIKYEGKSHGERNGGIFQALRRDVEVECLPADIPDSFIVPIEDMELGDVIHVSALNMPSSDVKLITSTEEAIASVVAAKEAKEETPAVAASEEEGQAVSGETAGAAKSSGETPNSNSEKKSEEKK